MATTAPAERADGRVGDLLRSIAHTLGRTGLAKLAAYVALSLGSALAGSVAAVCLVPLVRPGRPLAFGGGMLRVGGSVEVLAAVFAAATAGFALLRWLAAKQGAHLVSRYAVALRRRVHARLLAAPLPALAEASSAEIANVLTYNVEIVVQGFSALQQLLVAGVTSAVSLGFAFWVSPALMLAVPPLALLGLGAARFYGREQSQVSRRYVADMTRLFWLSEDFPRRLRHIRSFGREEAEQASYGDIAARLGEGYRRQLELVASGRLMLELTAAAGIAGVFVLARRWHGIDQGALVAVSLLLGRLLPYLVSTRQSFQQLRSAAPAFALWRRYMALPAAEPVAAPAAGKAIAGALRIEKLRLKPPAPDLDIAGLVLAPGELTLVFGDSGIGKSSLVDVLAGMAEPRAFAASADGRAVDFAGYRGWLRDGAYVSQSVRPWQPSVRECLRWAAPDADEAAMWRALDEVGLARRLAGGGDGLEAVLHGASSRLSGGELQRLLLAQVLLRRPVAALLDEATSALDAAAEIEVLSALKRKLPGTALVVVSHRASVAAIADQCLTLGAGATATLARPPGPAPLAEAAGRVGGKPRRGAAEFL